MPTLYIVATPVGNLQDITLRALENLKRVSVVYAKDTRVTRKLFDRYEIATSLRSYNQHSDRHKINEITKSLEQGDVALVTDAGTPGIADPGNELVSQLLAKETAPHVPSLARRGWGGLHDLKIVPIPGASAVTAAASVCGFNMSQFSFLGYVPKKKGRKKFFEKVARSEMPVILYETPHRIVKTLEELKEIVGANGVRPRVGARLIAPVPRRLVVCRELTKQFESIYRGTIEEVQEQVNKDPVKGEYVMVIDKSVKS